MCGRFALISPGKTIAEMFQLASEPLLAPRYNIAPTQPVGAVRMDRNGQREWALFHWGLIPSWAKDAKMGARMINARSETVTEKPSFRTAFKRRRCLVPADGFFEWQKAGNGKQPHYIQLTDGQPFAIAGLWEYWHSADGSEIESCTLLTTEPNELMATLHNRMPVIIHPEDYSMWLETEEQDAGQLPHLLRPYPSETMMAYPVSTVVNSPRNDDPACIAPLS